MNAYHTSKGLPIRLPQRYFPWVVLQTIYATRTANQVICLNTLDQEFLIRQGVAPEAITQLLLGVEDAILHRPPLRNEPVEVNNFLFFGTWVVRKGIRELIAATTTLMDLRPSARLTVAGFGVPPEVVKGSFPDRHRSRLNLIPKVQGSEAIAALYQQHQVLILPSVFEGQPLVMLEAAALGLAIVATDESGMHDFLQPDQTGLLIPVGDEKALAAALLRLCDDPALAHRLATAAREKVQQYTWTHSARMLLGAYEKAIQRANI
jgi:glycosyltransferase involved in cell wall biosynthesis